MGLFSGLAGLAKFGSNFFGGGAGSSSSTKGNTESATKSTSTGTRNERNYSDPFLRMLETLSADSLGNAANVSSEEGETLAKIRGAKLGQAEIPFDLQQYVSGITGRASEQINAGAEAGIKNTAQSIGGSVGGNSMASLLAANIRKKGAAELAGIEQEATASGVQIKSGLREQQTNELLNESQMVSGLGAGVDARLATLLSALKGGEQMVDITGSEDSTTKGSTSGSTRTPFNFAAGFGNLFKKTGE